MYLRVPYHWHHTLNLQNPEKTQNNAIIPKGNQAKKDSSWWVEWAKQKMQYKLKGYRNMQSKGMIGDSSSKTAINGTEYQHLEHMAFMYVHRTLFLPVVYITCTYMQKQ